MGSTGTGQAMQVLVVDDELLARQRTMRMIEKLDGYEVVGEAGNGSAALDAINDLDPDIVLLDIRMPGEDGLTAAGRIAELNDPPAVIFCTAYDDYALQAFDTLAVGYILKPLQQEQLAGALEKATRLNKVQLAQLQDSSTSEQRKNIAAKTRRGVELVPIEDIYCFMADQKYVTVYHTNGETLIDDTLKELEKEFCNSFVRVHRNALVAIKEIEKLERLPSGQYELQLKNTEFRPVVSRRHVSSVRELLSSL